ncbi:ABC transporter substrate-binding protein [Fusobacterium russii]|uniref:ABC transporter substrate-binding protein n=1 Tax=Fusobacterium russii TaxID=854 RepID=UPI0003AA9CBE|nr:ABC transporter substrate-binding protein [Fusobacterium russii]
MYLSKAMSIKTIVEKYPETIPVFKNIGFKGMENQVVLEKLADISLEKAMMIKKEDVDVFISLLKQAIDGVKRDDNTDKEVSLMGLLPCPVRIPLLEGFEKYLSDNKDIKLKYELKAAYSGLGWIKDEVIDKNDIDKLADMFISAGFDLFFDKDLMGKFKTQGIFKDLTGIEKYNEDFENENISLKDPRGDYSMIGVVPAIFIVNKALLGDREKPLSWEDILKPEFAKSVSLPIADFDLFNSILIHIFKLYGREGVKNLGRSLLSNLHPAQMIEAKEPVVTIMPYFFSKMVPEKGAKEVIWPKEGAIISPIFMLTKADKAKELEKVIKYMSGETVGNVLANQGLFPSVHPKVKNPINGRPMLWIGWDFIYGNDMGKLIKECESLFNEGANEE